MTKVSRCILAEKATMVVDHIAYHKLDERYDSTIFAERIPGNVGRALETSRCIQDYVFWDSEGERCDVVHSYEDLLTVIKGTDSVLARVNFRLGRWDAHVGEENRSYCYRLR